MSPTQNNAAIVAEDSFSGPGQRLLLFQKIRHLTLGSGFPENRADTEPSARRVCFASHPQKANPAGRASSLPSSEAPVPSEVDRFPRRASSLRSEVAALHLSQDSSACAGTGDILQGPSSNLLPESKDIASSCTKNSRTESYTIFLL